MRLHIVIGGAEAPRPRLRRRNGRLQPLRSATEAEHANSRSLVALSLVMAAGGLFAQAQQMPAEYIGVWAHERGSCDLAAADAHGEFPFLVVTRGGYG
ncbi:hypothetical protein V5F59_08550 [Xanthobacter autotrophicus DSM 431]|uniref:hypothetical protein n=1 Tax=Xanthobacter nonsaccharivorans TaxID=3119912 RepID=UPI003726CED2